MDRRAVRRSAVVWAPAALLVLLAPGVAHADGMGFWSAGSLALAWSRPAW